MMYKILGVPSIYLHVSFFHLLRVQLLFIISCATFPMWEHLHQEPLQLMILVAQLVEMASTWPRSVSTQQRRRFTQCPKGSGRIKCQGFFWNLSHHLVNKFLRDWVVWMWMITQEGESRVFFIRCILNLRLHDIKHLIAGDAVLHIKPHWKTAATLL